MRLRSNPRKHRQIKLPPPTDTGNPATGADTASSSAGGDGGDSKTEIPPKDTQGEDAPAGTDGGVQNDAPQHNDNAPANGTSDTQPENNRDMPGSDAGRADGGNQDTDAPKNAESQDGTEGNAVSEGTGMPANPSSENAENTEVAMNAEDANPPSKAENSDEVGQGGMQADEADGRQDAEEGLQGDDPQAVPPAEDGLKTGSLGEKYFDGTRDITTLVINGEAINLKEASDTVSRNHPGLMSDFDKVMVSQKQYTHLIYGAAKLKNGTYTLFVQGKPTERLPEGMATYNGKVLHFKKAYENNWFGDSAYQAAGTFTANVDFSQKTVIGKIDTKDPSGMGTQNFTAKFDGNNSFKGTWQANEEGKGDISGRFYGEDGAEMAGRYSYKDNNERKSGFGVFAGKKEASAR